MDDASNLARRDNEIALAKFIYRAVKELDRTAFVSGEPDPRPAPEGTVDWGKSSIDGQFDLIRLASMVLKEVEEIQYEISPSL